MKKKVILLILGLIILTMIFVLTSISKTKNNKSSIQKNTIKEVQKKSKKVKEKDKEDTKESTIAKAEESNQNVNSNDNKKAPNNMTTTNKSSGNNLQSSSASNSENRASSNVQSSSNNNVRNDSNPPKAEVQETAPAVDPNAVDTNHPLYSHHHGEITENCEEKGFKMQIENPDIGSFSCVPVYTVSGGIKGYYLDLH